MTRPARAARGTTAGPALVVVAAVGAVAVGGCAGAATVDSPLLEGAAARQCAALAQAAPDTVAGVDEVEVDTRGVALAWGDPLLVLRCGVDAPATLEPTSRCDRVDGVDWFAQPAEDGYRFSTVGRRTTVELFVPADYEPAGDALVDVADAVRSAVPQQDPCG